MLLLIGTSTGILDEPRLKASIEGTPSRCITTTIGLGTKVSLSNPMKDQGTEKRAP